MVKKSKIISANFPSGYAVTMVKDSEIISVNPWWKDAKMIRDDPEIQAWEKSKLRIEPRIMHKITYDFDAENTVVYTLRGTRQIGKTTMIKLQIRKFLNENKLPWNIFYYSFDLCRTPRELVDAVEAYRRITHRMRDGDRCYLFLDEVSTVPNWEDGIKWLVDRNKVSNSTIMATGSDAIDLRKSAKRLSGRRGRITESYDNILPPLKFSEYASTLEPDIKELIDRNDLLPFQNRLATFSKLANGEIDESVERIRMYQDTLDDLLWRYMYSGGIPLVINSQASAGLIPEDVYNVYMDSITGEWSRLYRNQDLLKRLGGEIVKSHGGPVSWNNMAQKADISSHKTVQDSVQTLSDLFIVLTLYEYNMNNKKPMFRRNKKIYFADPLFFHLFNGWTKSAGYFDTSTEYLDRDDNRGSLIESIVANHLVRLAFNSSPNKQKFDHHYRLFYYVEDNKEVDFVYYDGDKIEVPIEVKYRNKAAKDLGGMYKFLNRTRNKGLVISKDRLDVRSEYVMIPASVFLLLV